MRVPSGDIRPEEEMVNIRTCLAEGKNTDLNLYDVDSLCLKLCILKTTGKSKGQNKFCLNLI